VTPIWFFKFSIFLPQTEHCGTLIVFCSLTTKLTGGNGAQRNCRPSAARC
jgi:hypothetical protein